MLQKAFQRTQTMSLFQKNLAFRSMRTIENKNYVMPESVEDIIRSLDK